MKESPEIAKLAEALATAQRAIKQPKKTATGRTGNQSYKYADLNAVIESYREPLGANGLSLIQYVDIRAIGDVEKLALVTRLLHSSGEYLEAAMPIRGGLNEKETGSAITYARRYQVSALLGIAAEDDDDGARASEAAPRPGSPRPVSEPAADEREPGSDDGPPGAPGVIHDVRIKRGRKGEFYTVHLGNHAFRTFSKTIAAAAKSLMEKERHVVILYKRTQYGPEIEEIVVDDANEIPAGDPAGASGEGV